MSLLQLIDSETARRLLQLKRQLERDEARLRDLRQRSLLQRAADAGQLVYRPA